jgi:U3 small nucleolar RNA-associated protein 13
MGSAFPGVLPVPALMQQGLSGKTHFFATAGERGVVRIWRSDTGACLYTYSGSSSSLLQGPAAGSSGSSKKKQKTALGASEVVAAAAGDELLELMLLPGGKGLLAATGDARLLFFHPKVGLFGV